MPLEPLHLLHRAEANADSSVEVGELQVEDRPRLHGLGGLARTAAGGSSGRLDDEGDGSALEDQSQLGPRGGTGGVGEDTLALEEHVVDVGDETSRVPQGVLVGDPCLMSWVCQSDVSLQWLTKVW